jgi:hypothetical protein
MNYLAGIKQHSLQVESHIRHVLQGETDGVNLLFHNETTGGLDTACTLKSGDFKFGLVRDVFNAYNDGQVSFSQAFTIAEAKLDGIDAKSIVQIEWQGKRYSIPTRVAPNGLHRYWRFLVEPTNEV